MLSNRRRALLLLACFALAGCAQPDNSPDGFGEAARTNFVEACTGEITERASDTTTEATSLASPDTCACVYDYFAENVSYEDFEELDAEIKADPDTVPAEAQLALDRCAAGPVAPTTTTEAP